MAYLDHAATTPMLPEAVAAMTKALTLVGNASSVHAAGRQVRRMVEEAREDIADALGADPAEVLFTAGGTESDNLAVKGMYWARRAADARRSRIVSSPVEHHAVLDAVHWLKDAQGASVTWLEVDHLGRVHSDALRAAIMEDIDAVALTTVMWANNEVGTVNPIRELAGIASEYGTPLHTDAVQAIETLPVSFADCGAAALSLSGHKLGGPQGIGALLLARDASCTPVLHGGGQERDIRSGTLAVPSILGFAAAVRAAVNSRARLAAQLAELRDKLIAAVTAVVDDAILNGDPGESTIDGGPSRLPTNAHFTFPNCVGDSLLMLLDAQGIECATGSACTSGVTEPSHVLAAMGAEKAATRGSLRFSLGHTSTLADVAALAEAIGPIVRRARGAGIRKLAPNDGTMKR